MSDLRADVIEDVQSMMMESGDSVEDDFDQSSEGYALKGR